VRKASYKKRFVRERRIRSWERKTENSEEKAWDSEGKPTGFEREK
jgi:hypothetical protein